MTELQNYRMTDRTKTICPPIFDLGGIKNLKSNCKAQESKSNQNPSIASTLVTVSFRALSGINLPL